MPFANHGVLRTPTEKPEFLSQWPLRSPSGVSTVPAGLRRVRVNSTGSSGRDFNPGGTLGYDIGHGRVVHESSVGALAPGGDHARGTARHRGCFCGGGVRAAGCAAAGVREQLAACCLELYNVKQNLLESVAWSARRGTHGKGIFSSRGGKTLAGRRGSGPASNK